MQTIFSFYRLLADAPSIGNYSYEQQELDGYRYDGRELLEVE